MDQASEIIEFIAKSPKKSPVRLYYRSKEPLTFENCHVFSDLVIGDWKDIEPVLRENQDLIEDFYLEPVAQNSAVPLLNILNKKARIEPGAIIRDQVTIEDQAVIMMGAVINIGAYVGKNTMIDMNAVLGGRAIVKDNCHIGAGAVIAGVIEPASAKPVVIENNVLVGANAVVLEGVHIGENSVIAAGSVVTHDIPPNSVVTGMPGDVIKTKDEKTEAKTRLVDDLRNLD